MKNLNNYIVDSIIYEMAVSKSDFINKVSNLTCQIIENWCLIKLCDLYPDKSFFINRNHWCTELKSYILNIINTNIKTNNKHKYKYIQHELIDAYELNDKGNVSRLVRSKFNKEGLEKYINIIAEECSKSIYDICKILASDNINDIDDYIDGEID